MLFMFVPVFFLLSFFFFFFFNDTATTEIYTLSLHDALPIARMRNRNVEIRVDMRRVSPKNDNAVRENDSFLDVVRDDEHGACWNLVPEPELQKFASKRLGRKHIERRERLIHKQHFRL